MKKTAETDNKAIILRTAASIFAERGFDGARVDEIAKRAKVNKALIYYYFKSKEEILSILFAEVLEKSAKFINNPLFDDPRQRSVEEMKSFLNGFLDYLEERQDILRVMLMESLKRSPVNDLIFSLIESLMQKMVGRVIQTGGGKVDASQVMVTEFFTGIMPFINFVVYHEKWMEKFGVEEPELRDTFFNAFFGTHLEYSIQSYWKKEDGKDQK